MVEILLLCFVVVIFRILFASFGVTSREDLKKEQEAIKKFLDENVESNPEFKDVESVCIVKVKDIKKDNTKNEAFSEEIFLRQVENVVEMVLLAFTESKKDVLKTLLDKNLMDNFEKRIDKNLEDKNFLKNVIVSFENKEILSKNLELVIPSISVKLSMKQMNYVEDSNGNVIYGDKNKVVLVNEIWNFVKNNDKNISSPWLVESIEEVK